MLLLGKSHALRVVTRFHPQLHAVQSFCVPPLWNTTCIYILCITMFITLLLPLHFTPTLPRSKLGKHWVVRQEVPHRLLVCSFLHVMLWTSQSICNLPHFTGGWQVERAYTGRCCHSHFGAVDGDPLFPLWNGRQEHSALSCFSQALSWLPAGLMEWVWVYRLLSGTQQGSLYCSWI